MRLTFRVTTSGDRWAVAAPSVDFEKVWPKGKGDFDEAEFRTEVRQFGGQVMIGDKPGETCAMRFASILLHEFAEWSGNANDNERAIAEGGFHRMQSVVNRRAEQGRYGNVRVRIDPITTPFKGKVYHSLRLRVDRDGRDVPNAEAATHYCAMVLAYLLREIDRDLREHDQPPCEIADEVLLLAAERDREYYAARAAESNATRGECERNRKGFCAPCKFDCPHCRNGKCAEVATLDDEATMRRVPYYAKEFEKREAERRSRNEMKRNENEKEADE